jgi:hypothetical protein
MCFAKRPNVEQARRLNLSDAKQKCRVHLDAPSWCVVQQVAPYTLDALREAPERRASSTAKRGRFDTGLKDQEGMTQTLTQPLHLASAYAPRCRFCASPLSHTFVDLGTSPLCQRHVTPQKFNHAESFYPLHVYVCGKCFLVQLPEYVAREEIFDGEYAYFSSFSDTMLKHAQAYVEMMIARFGFDAKSKVVELASNDGYLLQYFVQKGVPCLGIEPTANTATAAEKKGVRSLVKFFGVQTAKEVVASEGHANLILGNNVLAHVPDINDFVGGMKVLLAPGGVITMEFPQLLKLIENNYWDTIYHEHFSYLSFTTVEKIFAHHGLTLFDVEEIDTHGGSIRIFARHAEMPNPSTPSPGTPGEGRGEGSSANWHRSEISKEPSPQHSPMNTWARGQERVAAMKAREEAAGHFDLDYYNRFAERVKESKRQIVEFFIKVKREGKSVAGYGAPGKGNTLLNYCGIRTDFLDYTADRSPVKQGNFLPGTRIPIVPPERIRETRPDYLFILVWNLKDEVMKQMSFIREWGGKFVVPMPELEVL